MFFYRFFLSRYFSKIFANIHIDDAIDLDFGFTVAAIVDSILQFEGEALEALLRHAIDIGSEEVVRLLFAKAVEVRDERIFYACRSEQISLAIVKLLVKHIQSITKFGPVIVEVAKKRGLSWSRYLVDCGFDVNVSGYNGISP